MEVAGIQLKESSFTKVTKDMWSKMSDDQQADALLSAVKDPDEAERFIGSEWEALPSQVTSNMHVYNGGLNESIMKNRTTKQRLMELAGVDNQASGFQVDDLVYNTRTKTVGIVRMGEERGEVKTDADGNVDVDELEMFNPINNPSHQNAKVAPSTEKEVSKRGLFNPFKQMSEL